MNTYYLLITILFHQIYSLYSEKIHKIIIANDINNNTKSYRYSFKTKGIQLIFDPNSDINLIPAKIKTEFIENGFQVSSPSDVPYEVQIDNGYVKINSILCDNYTFPSVNLILNNYGITFPTHYLFKESDGDLYEFVFLSHKDAENIIIGKELIELMDIHFENGIEIRNKDFIIKFNDE